MMKRVRCIKCGNAFIIDGYADDKYICITCGDLINRYRPNMSRVLK